MLELTQDNGLATLTFHRPSRRNALSATHVHRMIELATEAASDPEVRGIILRAPGETYLAGGDIHELRESAERPGGAEEVLALGRALQTLEELPIPVAAAVSGHVYGGGCELLCLCDFVALEDHVTLSFRHAKMGLVPAWGAAGRLLDRVGPLQAARVLFSASPVHAADAVAIGLGTERCETGGAEDACRAFLRAVQANPREVVAAQKALLRGLRRAWRDQATHALEEEAFAKLFGAPANRRALGLEAREET